MKAYLPLGFIPLALVIAFFITGMPAKNYTPINIPSVKTINLPPGMDLIQPRPGPKIAPVELDAFAGFAKPKPQKTVKRKPVAKQKIKLKLEAVLIDGDRHVAQINGRMVSTGDRLFGYTVKKITNHGVSLAGDHGEKFIRME